MLQRFVFLKGFVWKNVVGFIAGYYDIFAAAADEPEVNERGSSLIGKGLLYGACNRFSYETQGIVVGGKIKGARNCGYARMEDSGCAVEFYVIFVPMQLE